MFVEGDWVATVIAALGVKLCFLENLGFFKGLSRYKGEESKST